MGVGRREWAAAAAASQLQQVGSEGGVGAVQQLFLLGNEEQIRFELRDSIPQVVVGEELVLQSLSG